MPEFYTINKQVRAQGKNFGLTWSPDRPYLFLEFFNLLSIIVIFHPKILYKLKVIDYYL